MEMSSTDISAAAMAAMVMPVLEPWMTSRRASTVGYSAFRVSTAAVFCGAACAPVSTVT